MISTTFFAPYERKLSSPFRYGSLSFTTRRGFLLRRQTPAGTVHAEATPLPGHSRDTYEQVKEALESSNAELPPSLAFAYECLAELSNPHFAHPVRSNGLLTLGGALETTTRMRLLLEKGYSHFKVKVTPERISDLLFLLKEFPEVRYRIDANLSLNPKLLESLIASLEKEKLTKLVDYLEEPFAGVWNKKEFADGPLALAADESAPDQDAMIRLCSSANPPSVFILKPSVQGGLQTISTTIETLRSKSIRGIVTTALEVEPGRRGIISFLSRRRYEVAGLSTGFLFQDNYLADCPEWLSLPTPNSLENAWLDSLPWKECAC